LHPKDVIVRRWQDRTGKLATRQSDEVAFDDLAATIGAGAAQEAVA
jgi:hypothetical protein